MLRHINFLAEEEPQEGTEEIYVKCSGKKEKGYLGRSLYNFGRIKEFIIIYYCYYLLDLGSTLYRHIVGRV